MAFDIAFFRIAVFTSAEDEIERPLTTKRPAWHEFSRNQMLFIAFHRRPFPDKTGAVKAVLVREGNILMEPDRGLAFSETMDIHQSNILALDMGRAPLLTTIILARE